MVGGIAGKLTDKGVRSFVNRAAPGDKLADGRGLYLFITRGNGATWRIKYRLEGKERIYSIGIYEPEERIIVFSKQLPKTMPSET